MTLEELRNQLPDYAKDLKLNLSSLLNAQELTPVQLWGSLLAAALASKNTTVINTFAREAAKHLSIEEQNAVKAAAAIMAMNNVYFRFTHVASKQDYAKMPAGLRMNIIGNPGVDKKEFELWCLVVSIINNCGKCIDSHEAELVSKGMSLAAIQVSAKIAAVVQGIARTMDIEEALQEN